LGGFWECSFLLGQIQRRVAPSYEKVRLQVLPEKLLLPESLSDLGRRPAERGVHRKGSSAQFPKEKKGKKKIPYLKEISCFTPEEGKGACFSMPKKCIERGGSGNIRGEEKGSRFTKIYILRSENHWVSQGENVLKKGRPRTKEGSIFGRKGLRNLK